MKANKPLVIIYISLLVFSLIIGLILEFFSVKIGYNPYFYLLLCIATAGHFIEENSKKIWILEGKLTKKEPRMDRGFFILFSHTLVIVSFLYFIPILYGQFWSIIYGLTFSLMGISNGLAHLIILIKYKINTGAITGIFQILFGLLVWLSMFPWNL